MNKIASITPVTALTSFEYDGRTFLLSGESNKLKVWESGVKSHVGEQTIDGLGVIHGIQPLRINRDPDTGQYILVIWGDHGVETLLLGLLSGPSFRGKVCWVPCKSLLQLPDRLFQLICLSSSGTESISAAQFAAVSANNDLFFLSWRREHPLGEQSFSVVHSLQGPCYALYSASILVLNERLFVAAGSVFGDVVLWCVSNPSAEETVKTQTLVAEIHAHEGSVFDVKLRACSDPETGVEKLLLASCSDDRTITLYAIDIQSGEDPKNNHQTSKAFPRTGFAPPVLNSEGGAELIARVSGHLSRIWRVDFLPRLGQFPDLISFGEDATIQFWHRVDQSDGKSTFTPGTSWAAHLGKSIWAEVVKSREDGTIQVFTGGADGGIQALTVSTLELEDRSSFSSSTRPDGAIKNFCWSGDRNILVMTADGMISSHHLFDDSRLQVNLADADSMSGPFRGVESVGNIVVFESDELVLCSIGNCLYSYNMRDRSFAEIHTFDCKIMQILKAEDFYSRSFGSPTHYVLLKLAGESPYSFVELHMNYEHIEVAGFMKLELSNQVIITSKSILLSDLSIALLGCRDGAIRMMHCGKSQVWELYRSFRGIHRCDAVTEITVLVNLGPDESWFRWIVSTGRNGTVCVHKLVISEEDPEDVDLEDSGDVDLQTMNNCYVPFGPFIEGIKQVELDGVERIVVWGFHGSHFIVWDILHQQELLSVDCGGAARKWSFHLTDYGIGFMWMKASKLYVVKQRKLALQRLQPGLHGREIKAIATRRHGLSGGQLLATAAEDTTISFTLATKDHASNIYSLRPCAVAIGHNTGPQEIKFVANTDLLLSSGGLEELFVWKVTEIPKLRVGTVLLGRCPPATPEKDLRIMNFDTHPIAGTSESGRTEAHTLCAVVAYSDSSLRLWRITIGSKASFELIAVRNIGKNCLTAVNFMDLSGSEGNPQFILTAATDGFVSMLEMPENVFIKTEDNEVSFSTFTQRHKIHQGSIQAQNSCRSGDISYLVTAGDDNALAITRIAKASSANDEEDVKPFKLETILIANAHAASINGVVVYTELHEKGNVIKMRSVSKDQKIKCWTVYVPAHNEVQPFSESKVVLNKAIDTAIADAACIVQYVDQDGQTRTVVAGVGLEVWSDDPKLSPG